MDIAIWGTGQYGNYVLKYLNRVNAVCNYEPFHVCFFVDSDSTKQDKLFHERMVYAPSYIESRDVCVVVAVKQDDEIVQLLRKHGIYYYTFSEFVKEENALYDVLQNSSEQMINALPQGERQRLYTKHLFSECIKEGISFSEILERIGDERGVACLSSFCMWNYEEALRLVDIQPKEIVIVHRPHTVAFYYPRYLNGGIERVMSDLFARLSGLRYEMVLITDKQDMNTEEEYVLPKGIARCRLSTSFNEDPYQWMIEFADCLREYRVETLCSHFYLSEASYYLGILAQRRKIRFLVEIHNYYKIIAKSLSETKRDTMFRFTDRLIVLSREDALYWHERGYRSQYIPNPVKLPKTFSDMKNQPMTVLWIGRIDEEQKNVYDVVDVMREVVKHLPDAKMDLVGRADDDRIMQELRRRIKHHGLDNQIVLHDYSPEVDFYYQKACAMIITSSYEGFSLVLAEGGGYGVPAVVYDMPYLELLKGRKGYIAVPQRNTDAMAKAVVRILSDDGLRGRLSQGARKNIENFAHIDIEAKWENALQGQKSEDA